MNFRKEVTCCKAFPGCAKGEMMNLIKSIRNLSKTQRILWMASLFIIVLSFCVVKSEDYLTVIASLVGATALIFVGKGDAIGQFLTIVFAVLYAIISFECRYYGEMITYVGMTLPSAVVAMINWLRHPYTEREVKVNKLSKKTWFILLISSIFVTVILGLVLDYFGTANMLFSTISVTTSYFASMLTILRSGYYAAAYALNDIVLIILWILAAIGNINYLPMIICFFVFLINDIYGFINWKLMERRQMEREGVIYGIYNGTDF